MAIGFKPVETKRPAERLISAAKQARAIARGDAQPAAVFPRPGRPPSGKVRVTLLIDPAVVAKFKATGPGWQARMNDVLAAAKV